VTLRLKLMLGIALAAFAACHVAAALKMETGFGAPQSAAAMTFRGD
jgi:hypothetical protein